MSEFRKATLVFMLRREGEEIREICLAMKKRGFGQGRWNGAGGKVQPDETIERAAIREVEEELGVKIDIPDLSKRATIYFIFPHDISLNMEVHTFFVYAWRGEPSESEEMKPAWYNIADIPYSNMWSDDELWLPRVLMGETLEATFTFDEGDKVIGQEIKVVVA